ncbi:hypothetical protein [Sphingobacterium chungjuense]|uniref:hypothetical protein n=1 Tax=Sphingobacterium chungjuense TaxID=2675553 RepID=UPI001408F9A9|nr:hypothetical protein [Sphingobacterium chungjuense]
MTKRNSISKWHEVTGYAPRMKKSKIIFSFRAKPGVTRERILKDPKFVRTRENGYEFGRASRKAKQIRQQIITLTRGTADGNMRNRFLSLIHRIQKRDSISLRGERRFQDENTPQLRGFEFNAYSSLSQRFIEPLITRFDRHTGLATLTIPPFDPQMAFQAGQGATHIRFIFSAAPLPNTEIRLPLATSVSTDYIPLIGRYNGTLLAIQLAAALSDVVYGLVGISVYEQINNTYYPLEKGKYNSLTIVSVDVPDKG